MSRRTVERNASKARTLAGAMLARPSLLLVPGLAVVAGCSTAPPRCPDPPMSPTPPPSASLPAPQPASAAALGATWIGSFSFSTLETTEPVFWVDFGNGRACAEDEGDGEPLLHAELEVDRVRFDTVIHGKAHSFEGRRTASDTIAGEVRRDKAIGRFELRRILPFDRERFAKEVSGTFVTPETTLLLSARYSKARLFDATTGAIHAAYPLSDGTYSLASGLATTGPWAGLLRLERNASGNVEQVVVAWNQGSPQTAKREEPKTEEIVIPSDGATLASTLYLPAGAGPFPAVVFVHGSGKVARDDWWQQAMTRVYLREGFAVLLYDKRGVGKSTGTYVGPGAADSNNTSPQNIDRLARDAEAAVLALATRADIDKKRIGLTGISQAGWIMPLSASRSKAVAFMVSFSGPTVSTYLEDVHSQLFDDGARAGIKLEEADEIVHALPRTPPKSWRGGDPGVDPAPSLARMKVPALFLFGHLDTSIPVPESLRVLERLRRGHDWEVKAFPDAGHGLYAVESDTEAETIRTRGMQKDLLPTLRAWLTAHVRNGNKPAPPTSVRSNLDTRR